MAIAVGFDIEPVTACVGSVISGIDLRESLSEETVERMRAELFDRGVLFFRDQELGREEMVAFASNFGTPYPDDGYTFFTEEGITREQTERFVKASRGGAPQSGDAVIDFVYDGTKLPRDQWYWITSGSSKVTDEWHADTTAMAEPPIATMLRAVRLPPIGGDTLWASMYAAYDALSEPLQTMLDGLTAVHSMNSVLERSGQRHFYAGPDVVSVHPVVKVHPETGRKALYVNQTWTTRIVELEPAESAHVLALLFEHVKSPDFSVRWRWSPNDIALWDNRNVLHYAVADYDDERAMQRIVIAGPGGSDVDS
jgi:alpha-ketoglutarate-dependent taurine dioxygenase